MREAIFPGTFNPIHLGHLCIAESARQQFGLARVHFVLTPQPPHKAGGASLLPVEARESLLRAALAGNESFSLDLRELSREGPSYTAQTIAQLQAESSDPTARIGMIQGLDSFLTLRTWYQPEQLAASCRFLVAPRLGWDQYEIEDALASFHQSLDWELVDSPLLAISSSQIRQRKASGQSYRYLLPAPVYEQYREL